MSAENKPTINFLNKVAGKYVLGEVGADFLSKDPAERKKFLTNLAEELELRPDEIDIEGLSGSSEDEFIDFLRSAFQKYNQEKPLPFPSPLEGLND